MSSDSGYAYAKASWIIGKSFLGKRLPLLSGLHTLYELDRLVFPEHRKELPGRELLVDMERRIIERAVRQILSIVNAFTEPPKLLVRMIKGFEYSDLKECLAHIINGTEKPVISDIGRFKTVRFENYPDVVSMIKKTEFEFLLSDDLKNIKQGMNASNSVWSSVDLTAIETKLDFRFYQGLIESLNQLSDDDREVASRLIFDEISLRNCVWALRLRTYYQKSEIETAKHLMDFKLHKNFYQKRASVATDALISLDLPLDVRLPWQGWKWERFLNSEEAASQQTAVHWMVDPRFFQNAATQYLHHLAFHNFHTLPMSVSAIYCFIKLKQFEEDILTSVAEGLALGMDSSAVFKLLIHAEVN
ncbi:MAG: V-type ATPase subunit [Treponema sp.]|nr:V-type ATPase subunit [Treponema sp.]MCL2251550.1 V-type ATPase subunit [Treponema sp.]